jgi:SAM-dependent methyltransferase
MSSVSWLSKRRQRAPQPIIPSGRKVVLHVGCGPREPEGLHERFRTPDWWELRLDVDPECRPHIIANIIDMPEVSSESVDAVWSSHNIEHVFTHEVPKVFGEFLRVLKPGGSLLVTTPDLQLAAERIARGRLEDPLYEAQAGSITPLDMVYGHAGYVAEGFQYMAHRTGFTARTLERKLRDAGFSKVKVWREADDRSLWADACR